MGPEVVVPVTFLLTVALVFISRSHIGRAIADRIRGGSGGGQEFAAEVEALRSELDAVRGELADVNERLDFAERLLSRPAQPSSLPEPR